MFRRSLALAAVATLTLCVTARAQSTDPFLWLEDVNGARSQSWVRAENAKTLAVIQKDPRFDGAYADALAINQATDRIPAPQIVHGTVYNFWQDADHVRGIWRTTSIADYASAAPAWTTILDLDALAKTEGKNWIWEGADCASPSEKRCLISLSEGGEDAKTVREFDLTTGIFVAAGFVLPHSKQSAVWVDDDTLLVAREWAPGELTASGYPYVVKRVARGAGLDAATEIFRGTKSDVSDDPFELHDGAGRRIVGVSRGVSFFESQKRILTATGLHLLDMPLQSNFEAMVDGHALVKLEKPWRTSVATFPQGSLVSVDYAGLTADPIRLQPTLVFAPDARGTIDEVGATHGRAIVVAYENVRGRAYAFAPQGDGTWQRSELALPDDSAIALVDADVDSANAYVRATSFLAPTTIYLANAESGSIAPVKAIAAKFDATRDVVEQRAATSKDGTQIPYFIVHRKDMAASGVHPTIVNAYGGFGVSVTPNYDAVLGKVWLEHGGVYVLANIRGGGEFGPAWHEAGLKTHRQRIYDDFAAVARDLIASKVTNAKHLGIEGGSNGGLLMGVEFTQHPELYSAVFIAVPLLDMLRFEQIAAGASWVGEYGSVSIPAQRAFLASISPYNNLHAGVKYPKAFLFTTTKDDRVGPQHARKFAAKLAALHVPYYFYEVTEGGHAAGANIKERSFTAALTYTYFERQLAASGF